MLVISERIEFINQATSEFIHRYRDIIWQAIKL